MQVVNDGTLLISYKKYNLENNQQVSVINKTYFYSSLRGQFYDFFDLLTIFNIQEYSPKITNIKLSENGNYMLLILDKTGKSSNIAIKIKFDNGINDFLVNNLQPVQQ